jgi:peptide/nickel transport system substrate-binding protein
VVAALAWRRRRLERPHRDWSSAMKRRDVLKMAGAAAAGILVDAALGLAPEAVEPEAPRRGGVFRLRGEDPLGFDPHLTISFRTMTNLSLTHSRLVKVKAGPSVKPGTLPVEPDLAESWTQADNSYVFKLRKGVRWQPKPPVDGREVTAEDVKYTYERFLSTPGNPNRATLDQIEKIEVLDPRTIRFTLKEPFAWFLEALASTSTWIIAREAVEKFGDLRKAEACVGTGPWMLEHYEPKVRLTFVRHPHYFLPGLPYADGVEVTVDDDPASRFANWLAGKYDFGPEFGMVVRRLDLDLARQRKPGLQTSEFPVGFCGITWMKLAQAPFSDIRVRRAIAQAGNWKEILETNAWSLGRGVPNPAVMAAFKDWSLPLDELPPEGRRLYEQSIPEAKRLLAEAGYPAGFKTTVETTGGYGPDWMDAIQVTLRQLKVVGIEAELKLKEYGAYLATVFQGKFEHMAAGLIGAWTEPDSYLYRLYVPGQPLNAGGVDDARLTEMIKLQRRTLGVTKRREIIYDIQRYLSEKAYYLYGPSVVAVSAWEQHVRNFAPNIGFDYGGRLMAAWLDR